MHLSQHRNMYEWLISGYVHLVCLPLLLQWYLAFQQEPAIKTPLNHLWAAHPHHFPIKRPKHLQHVMGGIPSHGVRMPIRMKDRDAPNGVVSGFSSQSLQPLWGSQPAPVHIPGTQGMLDEIFRWIRSSQWDSGEASVVQTADTESSGLLESSGKGNSLLL